MIPNRYFLYPKYLVVIIVIAIFTPTLYGCGVAY